MNCVHRTAEKRNGEKGGNAIPTRRTVQKKARQLRTELLAWLETKSADHAMAVSRLIPLCTEAFKKLEQLPNALREFFNWLKVYRDPEGAVVFEHCGEYDLAVSKLALA